MTSSLFIKGLLLGLAIAAPVGPIGVLCIRRTLAQGRASGFVSGLGAATADGFYGTVAALGLSAISNALVSQQKWLQLLGGAFLCYLGVRTFLTRPAVEAAQAKGSNLWGDYISTLALTLTNPMTILSFVAILAGLGLAAAGALRLAAISLVGGVFCGSALWWLTLSTGVGLFRRFFTPERLVWVNRISGVVILAFGVWAMIQGITAWRGM
mgnify:FL=1